MNTPHHKKTMDHNRMLHGAIALIVGASWTDRWRALQLQILRDL